MLNSPRSLLRQLPILVLSASADRYLTRVLLSGVWVPPVQHLAGVNQTWITLGSDAFGFIGSPSRLLYRTIPKCSLPGVVGSGVWSGRGLRRETGLVQ